MRDHADRHIRPGLFKLQLVKGGPWLPAAIWRPCPIEMHVDAPWIPVDRFYRLQAAHGADSFGALLDACDPYMVWQRGIEIERWEFDHWRAVRRHIRLHEPDATDADPRRRIDFSKLRPRGPHG